MRRVFIWFFPLHAAALYGKVKFVRVLLEHGASVGAEDDESVTAFEVASDHPGCGTRRSYGVVIRTWCRRSNFTFRFLLVVAKVNRDQWPVPVYLGLDLGKRISPIDELWQCGILEMVF